MMTEYETTCFCGESLLSSEIISLKNQLENLNEFDDADTVYELCEKVDWLIDLADSVKRQRNEVLKEIYSSKTDKLRSLNGQEGGVMSFKEGRHTITSKRNKKVVWDQSILNSIADTMEGEGIKPQEYIDVRYNMTETAFKQLHCKYRSVAESARNVTFGTESVSISPSRG